jgi:hypothetical protein
MLLSLINLSRLMYTYDNMTIEPIPPALGPGQKLHILVPQDECIAHVNETPHKVWLMNGEQPLRKKGNRHAIMISDWIIETCGRLCLSPEQIAHQATLPEASHLHVTDARQIIYPGKNHNKWWNLAQLKEQLKDAINILSIFIQMQWLFGYLIVHHHTKGLHRMR